RAWAGYGATAPTRPARRRRAAQPWRMRRDHATYWNSFVVVVATRRRRCTIDDLVSRNITLERLHRTRTDATQAVQFELHVHRSGTSRRARHITLRHDAHRPAIGLVL